MVVKAVEDEEEVVPGWTDVVAVAIDALEEEDELVDVCGTTLVVEVVEETLELLVVGLLTEIVLLVLVVEVVVVTLDP